MFDICGALHDLEPFVQFKKREKHPWEIVNFNFNFNFLNCTNGTKSRDASHFCQVGGHDLTHASHEEAVIAIRNAVSPVKFVVRGLPAKNKSIDAISSESKESEVSERMRIKVEQVKLVELSSKDGIIMEIFLKYLFY